MSEWLTMDDDSPASWEDWQDEAIAQRYRADGLAREVLALRKERDEAVAIASEALTKIKTQPIGRLDVGYLEGQLAKIGVS